MSVHSAGPARTGIGSRDGDGLGVVRIALALAALTTVLDATVVGTALGTLATEFDVGLSTIAWTTVGYLLATAAVLPTLAFATTRFGARRLFLGGMIIFIAGSLAAALSTSATMLIIARVVQGIGGGMVEPTAMTLTRRLAAPDRIGRTLGRFSLVINVAPILGPLVGGALAASGHWRAIFAINVPLGLIVLALCWRRLPRRTAGQDATVRTDFIGLALLTVGFSALLFAISQTGVRTTPAVIIGLVLIALVLLIGYGIRTVRADPASSPPLDLRLIRFRGFGAALLIMALVGILNYSQMIGLPLYAEHRGLHGVTVLLLYVSVGVGLIIAMPNAGRLSDRFGPARLVTVGAALLLPSTAVIAALGETLPLPALLLLLIMVGLGLGSVAAPTVSSVYRTVPAESSAHATTGVFMSVQLAAAFSVTALGVAQSQLPDQAGTIQYGLFAALAVVIMIGASRLPGSRR
ncbi:DHA2 family efflux MFS transporter permease subunit [Microlunatus soli]|uniref:Drug resistance transporter, EmrB/QacA subfamily n=1 Tax=Microlunatus soli TaxID=630515 RepID=A0A1H1WFU1_9ACTN|nr:DHA2 family efflux MFS transporter permease subunit [Microlunatus soli]SDS95029.1 drug resistance transporter, EmrB/QacA subfamily [Microlunatus soli]